MKKTKFKKIVALTIAVIIALVAVCAVYLGDYYRADTEAISAFNSQTSVEKQILSDGVDVYSAEGATKGLIFYPGGKVEYTSYEPLMLSLAEKGILCVLIEMPFNLAVFGINAAENIKDSFPEIREWYIGGHSLGGSMAASYAFENSDEFRGVVLLGSYSTADLSETDLDVLSVFGSEDLVMNKDKYKENKANLPDDFTEMIIDGGCHAYFGMYGEQEGDGKATITRQEQISITAEKIVEFCKYINQV